jgi:regulator of ribonuclease activity A
MNQSHASFQTADFCDAHRSSVRVAQSVFRSFGGHSRFYGPIATMQVLEDNVIVKQRLSTRGNGQVLVVDGGGSLNCALVGDILAGLAVDNGWAGIVVNGCIRDSAAVSRMPVGIFALGTCPRRCDRGGGGRSDISVTFAGVTFVPGEYLYADEDGLVVSAAALLPES